MRAAVSAVPEHVGRYEVVLQLGQGAAGRVLLARDPVLGRQVAVKILRDDLSLDAAAASLCARKLKEGARTAAAMHHPGVVVVHDMGDDPRVGPFVVFELMSGGSLRERFGVGRLSRNEVVQLARSIGSTLAQAHASGVIHGNLKPENVLLSAAGPKLTDFGAPILPAIQGPLPAVGAIAPEVAAGGAGTAESDQFSLASILYEAATGASPFPGEDAGRVADGDNARPRGPATSVAPDLRSCPGIDAVFDRALSKIPQARFASCDAFAGALVASLETVPSPILTPTSLSSIVPKISRRWQNAAAVVAVGIIFALVLLGRQPRSDGVSLRSVAAAFAQSLGPTDGTSSGHRVMSSPASAGGAMLALPAAPKTAGREDAGALSVRPFAAGDREHPGANERGFARTGDRGSSGNIDRE